MEKKNNLQEISWSDIANTGEDLYNKIKSGLAAAKENFKNFLNKISSGDYNATEADVAKSLKTSAKGSALLGDVAFKSMIANVAKNIGVRPTDIVKVMNKESKLNPQAYNSRTGASGLIQFMPDTARALGTTTEEIRNMSGIEQMAFVEKYYKPWKGKIHNAEDLYLVTFFPLALNKPDNWILRTKKTSAQTIARQNPAISRGKNYITVGDVKRFINS